MALEPIQSRSRVLRSVVQDRIRAAWVTADNQLLTPVKFQHEPKLESATGPLERAPDNFPWLRVFINVPEAFGVGIGQGRTNFLSGFVQLDLLYPTVFRQDTQDRPETIEWFEGKALSIFNDHTDRAVIFQAPQGPVVNDEPNKRVRVITIPFTYEECVN